MIQRLDDAEAQLKKEMKGRVDNEKDLRANIDSQGAQLKVYMEETSDTIRKLVGVITTTATTSSFQYFGEPFSSQVLF